MTNIRNVETAIRNAQRGFTEWDWTWEFEGIDGAPVYPSDIRDAQGMLRDGLVDARTFKEMEEYAREVETAAELASDLGGLILQALKEGEWTDAEEYAERARLLEQEYGDSPSWGAVDREVQKYLDTVD